MKFALKLDKGGNIKVNATFFRDNMAEIINHVYYNQRKIIIRRSGIDVAVLSPVDNSKTKKERR